MSGHVENFIILIQDLFKGTSFTRKKGPNMTLQFSGSKIQSKLEKLQHIHFS